MIKVLLRHKIFQLCIDTIFNSIEENFNVIKKDKVPQYMWDIYHQLQGYPPAIKSRNQFKCIVEASNELDVRDIDINFFYNKMLSHYKHYERILRQDYPYCKLPNV